MKKSFLILTLLALAIGGLAQETHFDFLVTNSTGYDIYYRVVDAENQQVEVTYPCLGNGNYWWGYIKPEGKLMLSDTVTYNGTAYTVVAIGDHAFCGCSDLRGELELPQTVTAIGAGAFKGCSNLNGSLSFPSELTEIGDETFSGCSSFSGKLILPDSTQYIGKQAFLNCSGFRGMMMLPATLGFIGEEAFKGCTSINAISIKATTVPITATNAFDEIPTWITVNAPYNMKEVYQNAPGWSRFASHTIEKSIWNGHAEPWTHGSGTATDPYLIESAENLAWLAHSVSEKNTLRIDTVWMYFQTGISEMIYYRFEDATVFQDTCFRLVIDIDLKKGELHWMPIGNCRYINPDDYADGAIDAPHYSISYRYYYTVNYFAGQFDGNGYVISHAQYQTSYETYSQVAGVFGIGLFGIIDQATIRNVTVNDVLANPYFGYTTGGLVGYAYNSNVYDCTVSGTIKNSSCCGGIVGKAQKCRIEGCTAQIDFSSSLAGGIVGQMVCDTVSHSRDGIFHCGFIGNAPGGTTIGGIVALCQSVEEGKGVARIENCFSRGYISRIIVQPDNGFIVIDGYDAQLGGIVGQVDAIDTLFVVNCYSNDTITGIGNNYGNAQYYVGGILAKADPATTLYIKNCYHAGQLTSKTFKGGIIAKNTNMTLVRNCYFEEGCAPDDGFGVPMESDYMKTEAFVMRLNNGSTVYMMDKEPCENNGYPIFGTDGLIFVGAEWYYELLNDDGTVTYQYLQCVGDTTIGTERPKVIVRSNTQYDRNGHTEVTREYVYEENGVVYWWNNTLGKFTVLYDFGAEVGDEWTIEVGDETIMTKVYEASLQYIDGIPYKNLTIADPNDVFNGNLLGSIGHMTSFFPEKLMSKGRGYRVDGLRCYWLDNELIYKNGEEDCDAIYNEWHNGVDDDGPSTGSGTLVVYPNPANDALFVETQSIASLQGETYRITNVMGQTLMTGTIIPVETWRAASLQRIDISGLPAGMYFITAGGQTVKFVKR